MNNELKPYGEYKNAKQEWLMDIPKHWKELKAKKMFKETSIKNFPNEELLSATQNKGVIPRTMLKTRVVMPTGNLETFKLVKEGNFVISLRSFQGGLEYSKYQGIVSPAYTVLEETLNQDRLYYKYFFKCHDFIGELQRNVTGIRQGKNIDVNDFKEIILPIPPIEEQNQIVKYLDFQLFKINKFIKAKKKLIAVLKEQKQAVINEAVTKGINPDVKMKPSGIEWLEDIPEHWSVLKFKHFIKILSGFSPEQVKLSNDGVDYFKVDSLNNVNEKKILEESIWKVEKNDEVNFYSSPIILIPKRGAAIATNKVAITKNISTFDTNIMGMRLNNNVDINFICHWIKNRNLIEIGDKTTIPQINNKHINPLQIGMPNIQEQKEIVNFIEQKTAIIDKSISEIEKEISLIAEYKTRLISDVVTGKVDVRDVAINEEITEEIELEEEIAEEEAIEVSSEEDNFDN